ncbi:hypothetical protein RRG08_026208 [Elysia crispata]|uniref:Uncharacterized protein n=1 Tax=Elysia crispata TaxID=231223 RepID=A0AAE1DCU3_9GAST|nr:hypothetical protein RRG08_026208 [Elysia crispata]
MTQPSSPSLKRVTASSSQVPQSFYSMGIGLNQTLFLRSQRSRANCLVGVCTASHTPW